MAASNIIGVATSAVGGPFAVGICQGIERVLAAGGHAQFVVQGTPEHFERQHLGRDIARAWIGTFDAGMSALTFNNLPGVLICAADPEQRLPSIRSDNAGATRDLTLHLIDHGHTRIAFFMVMHNLDFLERLAGYQEALAARNLAADPALLFESPHYDMLNAETAFARYLAGGPEFTAVVASSDELAIGALRALTAAGRRVPEDVAIVGFDDISDAQSVTPPLTTARQTPALLGTTAAQVLVDMLQGRPPDTHDIRIPAQLIFRQSCGCRDLAVDRVPDVRAALNTDWREALAGELVNVMRFPLSLAPRERPEHHWPEVSDLIGVLGAALAGQHAQPSGVLRRAWLSAIAQNDRVATLEAVHRTYERAARILAESRGASEQEAVDHVLERSRAALHNARVTWQQARQESMERLARASNVMARMLFDRQGNGNPLEWLRSTTMPFACIASWSDPDGTGILTIEQLYSNGIELPVQVGQTFRAAAFPPQELIELASQLGAGTYLTTVPIHTPARMWGILLLAGLHGELFAARIDPQDIWSATLAQMFERREVERTLAREQEELQQAYQRERALAATVRDLGCPVLPVLPGLLLVPLIGSIDTQRAQLIIELVLRGVADTKATHVLLDLTGVPLVDTQVAASLLQTAAAAMLLGAQVALVGIRPEIAQSIVGLGISLRGLAAYPTLATALQSLQRTL